jgi:hypothetical protein
MAPRMNSSVRATFTALLIRLQSYLKHHQGLFVVVLSVSVLAATRAHSNHEKTNGYLRMTIWNSVDHGASRPGAAREGIGLKGVRERVSELKGVVRSGYTFDSFTIVVTIPIEDKGENGH